MTAYTPVWKVLIEGVEYQNITLTNLTISSGRTNIYEQAVAGLMLSTHLQSTSVLKTSGASLVADAMLSI